MASSPLSGLDTHEATARLARYGPNELPGERPRGIWYLLRDVVREPMIALLLAAGTIYLLLGEVREAAMLLFFVVAVMGITLVQSRRTEHVLQALRDLSSPRALVLRDGIKQRIAGRAVVPGDLIFLTEGDRVPADALLLASQGMQVDESLLTGEALPVRKCVAADAAQAAAPSGAGSPLSPGGEDTPQLYSGTLVAQGQGIACVTATGTATALGRIGKSLASLAPEDSPLQREMRALVKVVALIGLVLCALVVLLYGLSRGNWLEALLAGIALAMSILPEEFPLVLTVFLALGAWRIAHRQLLTRRVPALETLGAATVLCADKTGTMTENRMSVAHLITPAACHAVDFAGDRALPEAFHELVEYSVLASAMDPFDPMEQAFKRLAQHTLTGTEHLHGDWRLVQHYPLSRELLAMSYGWAGDEPGHYVVAAKGAPEAIADLCHLPPAARAAIAAQVDRHAAQGLRLLAIAKGRYQGPQWPPLQHDIAFDYVGMIALTDPVRPAVPSAIRQANQAGIQVVMITGDYPATARAVATQAGIATEDGLLSGAEVEQLPEAELRERLRSTRVFARVAPEQKLRLVRAFQANGEIVAMTGDGVNDAPALKAAHIGIAMGGRGTDVAREAAALVLLDDDFASIVDAIRLGRRIFDNLHKALSYIIAAHVPIAGMALLPLLLGLPLALSPAHIVFLELVINSACAIVFEAEPEEPDLMRRPPRRPDAPLLGWRTLAVALAQGLGVLLAVAAVYIVAQSNAHDAAQARALAFTTLVVGNLCLILANRSWKRSLLATLANPNPALWWILGGTLLLLALVLQLPSLRAAFQFAPLHASDLALCFGAGLFSILWFELFKLLLRRRRAASRR